MSAPPPTLPYLLAAVLALLGCREPNPAWVGRDPDGGPELDAAGDVAARRLDAAPPPPDVGGDRAATPPPDAAPSVAGCTGWWQREQTLRRRLTVTAGPSALPPGGWALVSVDHAAMVRAGARADGADLRVVRWGGGAFVETARALDEGARWNTADTRLWVRAVAPIAAGRTDDAYQIYAGHAAAAAPVPVRPVVLRAVQSGLLTSRGDGTLLVAPTAVRPDRTFLVFQARHASERPVGAHILRLKRRPSVEEQ